LKGIYWSVEVREDWEAVCSMTKFYMHVRTDIRERDLPPGVSDVAVVGRDDAL